MKIDWNLASLWAVIAGTASVLIWVFTNFASAADLKRIEQSFAERMEKTELNIAFGQFYDRLDDYHEALDEENDALAEEYLRQMERLQAVICKHEPEWERCEVIDSE
jgi:Skp family chaperone for outer membrane proteins